MRTDCIAITFMVAATLVGCISSHEKTALAAIENFHRKFNDSEFSQIYDGCNQKTKESISKEDFVRDMKAMRAGQGAALRTSEIASDYQYLEGVSMIKVLVEVTFEKGVAREEFIYYFSNRQPQLASYRFLGPK